MAEKRKVDELAGEGSFLDRLRKRRDAVEEGDLEGAPNAFTNAQEREAEKNDQKDKLDEERKKNQAGWQKHLTGDK